MRPGTGRETGLGHAVSGLRKMACGFRDQVRARHRGEKSGLDALVMAYPPLGGERYPNLPRNSRSSLLLAGSVCQLCMSGKGAQSVRPPARYHLYVRILAPGSARSS